MTTQSTWESEYDWEVDSGQQGSSMGQRDNVLCVLFDSGAQRQFSKVRITLCCNNNVPQSIQKSWQITPKPLALSVTNRTSSESAAPNPSSLPIYHATFVADQFSPSGEVRERGELTLVREGLPGGSLHTVFELEAPLTGDTQSVSVCFASSRWLCTLIPRGRYFHANNDATLTMGRVVRVFPSTPVHERKTITLPIDILRLVFENIFDAIHQGWRKDLMSCALMCHDWKCALDFLLSDFRSTDTQLGAPPEITQLAALLIERPNLSRCIKHLSIDYFERHLLWTRDLSLKLSTPLDPSLPVQAQHDPSRRSQFAHAFLSIIRSSRQLQSLFLSPYADLLPLMTDLPNAIRGLTKLESLEVNRGLSMADVLSCISTCPSLKRLVITAVNPPSDRDSVIPSDSLTCSLTQLKILNIHIREDELAYIVSSSSHSLQRLSFSRVTELTNAGLLSALRTVSKSLVFLHILGSDPQPRGGEEHALDAVIADMERLERLEVVSELATKLMLERRSQAFEKRQGEVALPVVELKLVVSRRSAIQNSTTSESVATAQKKQWPGWKMITGLDGRRRTQAGQ